MDIKTNMNPIVKIKLDSAIAKNNWVDIKELAQKGYLSAIEAYYNKVIPEHKSLKEDNGFTFVVCSIMINELKQNNAGTMLVDNLDAGILHIYCDREPIGYYTRALVKGIKDSDIEYALKVVEAKPSRYYEFLRSFFEQLLANKDFFNYQNLRHLNSLEPKDRIKVMSQNGKLTPVLAAYLLRYGKAAGNVGTWEDKYSLEQIAETGYKCFAGGESGYMYDLFQHEGGFEILDKLKDKEQYSFFAQDTKSFRTKIMSYDPIESKYKESDIFYINLAKFISGKESYKETERNIYTHLYHRGHKEYAPLIETRLKDDFHVSDGYDRLNKAYEDGYVHARLPLAMCLLEKDKEQIKEHKERIVELLSGEIEDGNEKALACFEKLPEFDFTYTEKLYGKLSDLYKREVNIPPNVMFAYYKLSLNTNSDKKVINRWQYQILKKSACKKYVPAMSALAGLNDFTKGIRSGDRSEITRVTEEPEYEFCLRELYKAGVETYMEDFLRRNSLCEELPVEEQINLCKKYYGKYQLVTSKFGYLYLSGKYEPDDDFEGRKLKYELLSHMERFSSSEYQKKACYELAGGIIRKEFEGIAKVSVYDAIDRLNKSRDGNDEIAEKASLMLGIMCMRGMCGQRERFAAAKNGYLAKAKKLGNATAEKIIEYMA